MRRYLMPRLQDFVFILIFVGALMLGARMINTDSDLGRHITLGTYMLQSRHVPTQDILSFTKSGEPRPPYEWLAQLLMAGAYRLLGLDGVVILASTVIAATFSVVYVDCMSRSQSPLPSLLMATAAAVASSLHWLARPHVLSLLFFAIWVAMLERLQNGKKPPAWAFPALMLVWANTHGGFIFGFLALAAYAGGWLLEFFRKKADWAAGKRLMVVTGTSLVASLVTPAFWASWQAVLNNRSTYILQRTAETRPLEIGLPNVWPSIAIFAGTLALMLVRRRETPPSHAMLVLGFGLLAAAVTRNIPLAVIICAPICSDLLVRTIPNLHPQPQLIHHDAARDRSPGFIWCGLAVALVLGAFVSHRQLTKTTVFQLSPQVFPVAAADWLTQYPVKANIFNDFNWGGYLLFRLWPAQEVYIDSQSDFYGETFIREYSGIVNAEPGWDEQLARRNVSTILVPVSFPLAVEARRESQWQVAYEDSLAIILMHR